MLLQTLQEYTLFLALCTHLDASCIHSMQVVEEREGWICFKPPKIIIYRSKSLSLLATPDTADSAIPLHQKEDERGL
ncbi:hypothetical protein ACJW30_07G134500 [Castanea mollissima]